ncbi:MAG: S-adenosylmethionine synthetase [Candidatus Hecatellales archaeon ex4484_218]|nr:MAG: S-adenosylmethionine synthetase [Candidatus Hecatellales archaeon ex4484_218]
MGKVFVEKITGKPVAKQSIEIVERKGRGHPDYLADASAEKCCQKLCKYYLENFGIVLHHNVDKGLVVGGRSNPKFGGGEVLEPIEIIVAGRAITQAKKKEKTIKIPVEELGVEAVKDFIKGNFRFLDPDKHVKISCKIREGSVDLIKVFEAKRMVPLANDTSFGVCFAPLSPTEKLVLETEKFLNSESFKKTLPEVGEDIKVMGFRQKNRIRLTISAAMVSSLIPDKSHYLNVKDEICRRVEDFSSKITDMDVYVKVNTADNYRRGIFYLTVTGTSAEQGDDGNPGRGNRVNGLITPCRQMSLEATAGKNPVSHVGKIYNVLAKILAEKILREVKGVDEVYVKILSQIGKPITEPQITNIQVSLEKGYSLANVSADIKSIVDEEVANVPKLTSQIINGKFELF